MAKVKNLFRPLASVQLTLVCLGLMMALVVLGTLAQVNIGTFAAQQEYFNRFAIWASPLGFRIPIFPGGLSVGALWFLNLIASFLFQFKYVMKKAGVLVSHFGLMLLLLGQFLTQMMAHESQMVLSIGETKQWTESPRDAELVFTNISDPSFDEETSIPESRIKPGGLLEPAALPFKIKVVSFFPNAELSMSTGSEAPLVNQGVGSRVAVKQISPTTADDELNAPTAVVEILEGDRSRGTWLVSTALGAPQRVHAGGREYSIAMRMRRTYLSFSIKLKEFRHDNYPGTNIPKNFSSLVHLIDSAANESRDVLIYMNHPLRYGGKTIYQASFANNDTTSIFQVVDNPAWLTPYVACCLVVAGLAIQFLMHLSGFMRRRT